jgi:putative SOS response-associated peptidase YedK
MPVILERADWPVWLGKSPGSPASLLYLSPDGTLRVWPVDWRLDSPMNGGPDRANVTRARNGAAISL